ncbi:hypothetical protein [Granulicella sibirica]|uniref:Uncharacterized protein n=1 Tax=Granulicella sibirica TaxID=2479048 RepID=A0A4Q0SV36_9BACT|nr:hypothetical protein [Granulicella sibirica]RXH54923.1 hypothetical protein GRAN_4027 [Granulicella sibirica]
MVLCHRVLSADRESLRSALREIRPLIKCLLLIASVAIHDLTPNELSIETINGPTALIIALNQMTGRHGTLESGQPRLSSFRRG